MQPPAANSGQVRYWNSLTYLTVITLLRLFDTFTEEQLDKWVPSNFHDLFRAGLKERNQDKPDWKAFLELFTSFDSIKAVRDMTEKVKDHMRKHGVTEESKTKPKKAQGSREAFWRSIMASLKLMTELQSGLNREFIGDQIKASMAQGNVAPLPSVEEVERALFGTPPESPLEPFPSDSEAGTVDLVSSDSEPELYLVEFLS